MPPEVSITRVQFENFKTLQRFSITLDRMNVLVGPNNAGKSTIVGAFRVLAAGLQRAHARRPDRVMVPEGTRRGYPIAPDAIPISIENVHTNYAETDTLATFYLSNGTRLILYFPPSGDPLMLYDHGGGPIQGPSSFRREFPISVSAVPVLGPVEHEEPLVQPATVQRNLATHRASRNFRNYWLQHDDEFDDFRELIRETWPEMDIRRPEIVTGLESTVAMFCVEGADRISRELYWVGSGFQIWCQLLAHITRARRSSIVVIDEPEIYLHPQLQRTLLSLLRNLGPDVLIATHSSDVIQEADPTDILLIQGSTRSAKRVGGNAATRSALELIGAARNEMLTSAARTRRIAFVEGDEFKLLRQFAERARMTRLARTSDITPIPLGGFLPPQQILQRAQGFRDALGEPLQFAVILDRDFRPDAEIADVRNVLSKHLTVTHIHRRKEIENYLLVPAALDRAIAEELAERQRRGTPTNTQAESTATLLVQLTEDLRYEVQGQYVGRQIDYRRKIGEKTDHAQISAETSAWFDRSWSTLEGRLSILPGKRVLSVLNAHLQREYGVTITARRIVAAMHPREIPSELTELLRELDGMLA